MRPSSVLKAAVVIDNNVTFFVKASKQPSLTCMHRLVLHRRLAHLLPVTCRFTLSQPLASHAEAQSAADIYRKGELHASRHGTAVSYQA
jgi:hypothetical protein